MKKNTTEQAEKQEKKKDRVFYTIMDRYLNFCEQANIVSGEVRMNDIYINGWFSY